MINSYELSPKTGTPSCSLQNIRIFIEKHYKDRFKRNSVTHELIYNDRLWNEDIDLPIISNSLTTELGIKAKMLLKDVIMEQFGTHEFNPMRDWLDSLQWDGIPRLETMFHDYLGADDTPLTREMTKKWMVAAVKRIYQPGCKFDNVLILAGPQGGGKTTIMQKLCPDFAPAANVSDISNTKEVISVMNKSWIILFDELADLSKKDMNTVKTFLSKTSDTVRLPYERQSGVFPRTCVFGGSTNENSFLRDYTTNYERRFWIIKCTYDFSHNKLHEYTDYVSYQIVAEAKTLYLDNPDMYLDLSQESMIALAKEQKSYKTSNEDPFVEQFMTIMSRNYNLNNRGNFETVDQFYSQFITNATSFSEGAKLIDRIPITWVNEVARRTIHVTRTPKYIEAIATDDFICRRTHYNGVMMMCLIRRGSEFDC